MKSFVINAHENRLFVGGRWTTPSGRRTIDVTSAGTGEHLATVPEAGGADRMAAVLTASGLQDVRRFPTVRGGSVLVAGRRPR